MTSNRALAASLIITASMGIGFAPIASASTDDTMTVTVDGHDYPVCHEEDCSDQVGQIGVWTNRAGHSYLIMGEDVTVAIQP